MKVYMCSGHDKEVADRLRIDLLSNGFDVYEFIDPSDPRWKIFQEPFDPETHSYSDYMQPFRNNVLSYSKGQALKYCDIALLLLPCSNDALVEWGAAVGLGKYSIVAGCPPKGGQSLSHMWAEYLVDSVDEVLPLLLKLPKTVVQLDPEDVFE